MGEEGLLSLQWNNHKTTLHHMLSNIRARQESYADITLACEGKLYPVHKIVLSMCSEYFEKIFEVTTCKHPVVVLKDIRQEDLECLLNYMYVGEVNVVQEKLSSLIKAAECLRIKGLAVPDEDPNKSSHSSKGSRSGSSNGRSTEKRSSDDSYSSSDAKRRKQDSDGHRQSSYCNSQPRTEDSRRHSERTPSGTNTKSTSKQHGSNNNVGNEPGSKSDRSSRAGSPRLSPMRKDKRQSSSHAPASPEDVKLEEVTAEEAAADTEEVVLEEPLLVVKEEPGRVEEEAVYLSDGNSVAGLDSKALLLDTLTDAAADNAHFMELMGHDDQTHRGAGDYPEGGEGSSAAGGSSSSQQQQVEAHEDHRKLMHFSGGAASAAVGGGGDDGLAASFLTRSRTTYTAGTRASAFCTNTNCSTDTNTALTISSSTITGSSFTPDVGHSSIGDRSAGRADDAFSSLDRSSSFGGCFPVAGRDASSFYIGGRDSSTGVGGGDDVAAGFNFSETGSCSTSLAYSRPRQRASHVCRTCGLVARDKTDLRKHMYTHTGETPHKCPLCPHGTRQSSNLISHVRKFHPHFVEQFMSGRKKKRHPDGATAADRVILMNSRDLHPSLPPGSSVSSGAGVPNTTAATVAAARTDHRNPYPSFLPGVDAGTSTAVGAEMDPGNLPSSFPPGAAASLGSASGGVSSDASAADAAMNRDEPAAEVETIFLAIKSDSPESS